MTRILTKKAKRMYRRYFADPPAIAGDSLSPNLPGPDLVFDFSSNVSSWDICGGFRCRIDGNAMLEMTNRRKKGLFTSRSLKGNKSLSGIGEKRVDKGGYCAVLDLRQKEEQ